MYLDQESTKGTTRIQPSVVFTLPEASQMENAFAVNKPKYVIHQAYLSV